jgi:hypothetical protein
MNITWILIHTKNSLRVSAYDAMFRPISDYKLLYMQYVNFS